MCLAQYGLSSVKKNEVFRVKQYGLSSVKKNEVFRVKQYRLSIVKKIEVFCVKQYGLSIVKKNELGAAGIGKIVIVRGWTDSEYVFGSARNS